MLTTLLLGAGERRGQGKVVEGSGGWGGRRERWSGGEMPAVGHSDKPFYYY